MEAKKFFKLLKKHRLTLVIVPLLVASIAFVLLRKSPETFTSRSTLSAGIADESQQLLTDKDLLAENKTAQQFSNLIQMIQMKKIIDQVSYDLIIHDLKDSLPFRKKSKLVTYLNKDAKASAISVYEEKYKNREYLSYLDDNEKGLIEVIGSMGYDKDAISKKLKVYRVENSDFVVVEYESESPALSAYVVNKLCEEFIGYYSQLKKDNEYGTIVFLDTILAQKKDSMYRHMNSLKNYKEANHVLDINEQTKTLYSQIVDYESKIQTIQKDIDAYEGALKGINNKFKESDTAYLEARLAAINQQIVKSKQQLNIINDAYIKSNFNPQIKLRLDSMRDVVTNQINQSNDKYILNPLTIKQNLVTEKQNLEVNRDLAKNSLKSMKDELTKLNRQFEELVPNQARIQAYEGDLTLANQEYIDILNKYNQTNLTYNSSIKIKVIEPAIPGKGSGSKKMLLVVMSGIISFVVCILVIFILFYLDNSISSPQELADKTDTNVLGFVPLLKDMSMLDLKKFWSNTPINASATEYKNQLRSARFEIDHLIHTPKLVNITSLTQYEGKSLFSICLASAYLMISKKVLLIDGNFSNPAITDMLKPEIYLEDYLNGESGMPRAGYFNEFVVMGNKGGDNSLFEITDEAVIRQKIQDLKEEFDVIFIESSALDTLNRSKEWNSVVDNIIAVYEADKAMSFTDKANLKYLKSMPDQFIGWIMNKVILDKPKKQKKRKR